MDGISNQSLKSLTENVFCQKFYSNALEARAGASVIEERFQNLISNLHKQPSEAGFGYVCNHNWRTLLREGNDVYKNIKNKEFAKVKFISGRVGLRC